MISVQAVAAMVNSRTKKIKIRLGQNGFKQRKGKPLRTDHF